MYVEERSNDSAPRVSYKQAKSRFLQRPPFYLNSKMADFDEKVALQEPTDSQPLFLSNSD
mgnify:FL=1|jgi:hypothetical protein